MSPDQVRWFKDIQAADVASVGRKNASLGEMYSTLSGEGLRVPNGFALTVEVYRTALTVADAWPRLARLAGDADFRFATRFAADHDGYSVVGRT